MRRRSTTPARRWVQVLEDDQGRAIDMTIVRPNTPQHYKSCLTQGVRCESPGVTGCSDCGSRHKDHKHCTVVVNDKDHCCSHHHNPLPPTCHPLNRPISVSDLPDHHCCPHRAPPTCHPSRRPMTAINRSKNAMPSCTYCDHDVTATCVPDVIVPAMTSASGYDDRRRRVTYEVASTSSAAAAAEAARDALLTIYQAGKPDEMFHYRAPSTAVLQSMLSAVTMETSQRNMAAGGDMLRKFKSSPLGTQLMRANTNSGLVQLQQQTINSCQKSRPTSCVVGCCTGSQHGNGGHCLATASTSSCCRHGNRTVMPPDVIGDVVEQSQSQPVKVNVECAANTDTVVNLRVQSRPLQRVFY